ncbi:HesA/MoeB/ThiF family protein [Taibaiella koreensis]|uniref:HesA/MoeB/ThiF family protein n=1 Tax=Taibaiella koreensis TaxID=1268548 RepID=UPI000E59FFE7|nr:HesA/MoeB/ThiF family protein [Taibaiella koreensis]
MFTTEEVVRYSRQIILEDIGPEGQRQIKQGRVLVIGAGGLGCPVLQYLNAVGIGTLGIAEFDVVEATNLHRQILYRPSDIGRKKATAAIEVLHAHNPYTQLVHHDIKVDETNAAALVADYDLVVDGCDNFNTRYAVNDACVQQGKPLVYGSILGFEGQVTVFNRDGSGQLRDLFPEPPDADEVPSCSENGVLGTVPGIIGTIMAQAAIHILLGQPSFEGRFLLLDTRSMERKVLSF